MSAALVGFVSRRAASTNPTASQARALGRHEIEFTEIRGNSSPGVRRRLHEPTGRATVPQIMIDGASVGGASDLAHGDRRGVLMPLVQRDPFPRAVAARRLNPVGLLTAPFGGTCGVWQRRVDILERDGQSVERFPAGSAEQAVQLAAAFNEHGQDA